MKSIGTVFERVFKKHYGNKSAYNIEASAFLFSDALHDLITDCAEEYAQEFYRINTDNDTANTSS